MRHKTFYPIALSCAFLALSCGACLIGCDDDDEADDVMRYTLAEEMMTRSEGGAPENEVTERKIEKSTICAVPLKGVVRINDTEQEISFSVKTELHWTKKITTTTTDQGSLESISIENVRFDDGVPSLDQENNRDNLRISSFQASVQNPRMDGDVYLRFGLSANCSYTIFIKQENGEEKEISGTAVYSGGEMIIEATE